MAEKIEALLAEVVVALNRIADNQHQQLEILQGQADAAAEARKQGAGATDLIKNIMGMMQRPKE